MGRVISICSHQPTGLFQSEVGGNKTDYAANRQLTYFNNRKGGDDIDYAANQKETFCGFFLCFFLSCVCYALVRVYLLVPCGLLLGKG